MSERRPAARYSDIHPDLPIHSPDEPAPVGNGAVGRKCRRHDWERRWYGDGTKAASFCLRCDAVRDDIRSRRGKSARSRGLSIQREVNRKAGIENIPGNGPKDGASPRFVSSVKSGPAWYSMRVERELDALPVDADQTAVFIAASTPGPGHTRRSYVQMSMGDLARLAGEHAQAAVWIESFRKLADET